MYLLCKLFMNKYKCLFLTELPGLFSVYVSVLGSTASSASRILSTGMSSLNCLLIPPHYHLSPSHAASLPGLLWGPAEQGNEYIINHVINDYDTLKII